MQLNRDANLLPCSFGKISRSGRSQLSDSPTCLGGSVRHLSSSGPSRRRGTRGRSLFGEGELESFLGADEVVEVVGGGVDVDLDPVDPSGELVVPGAVVLGDGCSGVAADVEGLVHGEEELVGALDAAPPDGLAVDVEGDGAALADAAAVVGELHPRLMTAGRQFP